MANKIKEDLVKCLQSFKGISPKNKLELNKVITTLQRPDVVIPNDHHNKQKINYLLGLLFTQMPELVNRGNEKPLALFSSKAELTQEPTRKPSKNK